MEDISDFNFCVLYIVNKYFILLVFGYCSSIIFFFSGGGNDGIFKFCYFFLKIWFYGGKLFVYFVMVCM